MRLVIGNKNYSSWSLRPWLAMRQAGFAFEEVLLPLYEADSKARLLEVSPSGKVPCLIDGPVTVWESIAILEYLAERVPALWPADASARAHARAVSAEMHAGFAALRTHMPMDCRAALPGQGCTPEVERDIARILSIWAECRRRFAAGGPFLFGEFCNADAMYAPVAWRFLTYAVELPVLARDYVAALTSLPAMQDWLAAARAEPARP